MTDHGPLKIFDLEKIAACAEDLNKLGPDTEPEFLNIGNTLNSLAGTCYEMTDDAVKLSSLAQLDGDLDATATESFAEDNAKIFEAATSHIRTTLTSLGEGSQLLVELLSQMKKLREPLRRLQSIGKTFRVLGIGIKVESSRTADGMQGFVLLAEEVAEIARLVDDNCRFCSGKAERVEGDISISQQVLSSGDNSYDDSGERAIYNILQSLEDIGQKADQLAAGIQESSTAMIQGISDVVMAMQFHDITRQQLENVSFALSETISKAQALCEVNADETNEQAVLEIYSILSIQVAHLNSIYEQVRNARLQIENGLYKTMEHARIQAQDARTLLEMDGNNKNKSIVTSLEREIESIVMSLNKSLKIVTQAAKVSREVYDNVLEIDSFVLKIEAIAFDVKILAINAMVEALKTDASGNTLTVLAKELSSLSQDTRDGANDCIEMLQSITQGTEKQLQFSTNLDQSSIVVDEMIDRAKEFTGTILSSLEKVSTIGHKMNSSSRDLSSKITQLIPGIQFPQILGDRIDQNWQTVCQTIDQIEEAYPQFKEGSPEVRQMLEKLAQKYVMERERSIHAQVAGGTLEDGDTGDIDLFEDDGFELFDDDTDRVETSNNTDTTDEDYGDNIELF